LHPSAYQGLVRLNKEAERDGAYRVAKRLRSVVLDSEGRTSGALAEILQAPRSKAHRSGCGDIRPMKSRIWWKAIDRAASGAATVRRSSRQRSVAYGLDSGIWTSPMIAWVIEEEFGVQYHPGHLRKLLHGWRFSMQRPRRQLARAPTQPVAVRSCAPAFASKPANILLRRVKHLGKTAPSQGFMR
jgi:winged helix-turn-helix protein